ncbi:cholera enterotoxin subunit A2, partial [Vibrio cholerae]|nr:cholera enterotoxin subunit A2 [Vibrio cholerae]
MISNNTNLFTYLIVLINYFSVKQREHYMVKI